MEKLDPKFLYEIEMPDVEYLSVLNALELTIHTASRNSSQVDLILRRLLEQPEELNDSGVTSEDQEYEHSEDNFEYDPEAEDHYLQYIEDKSIMSPAKFARSYPYEAASERHESTLFKMFKSEEIILLDKFGVMDARSDANDIDRSEVQLKLSDFVKFANAVNIGVFCDLLPILPINDTDNETVNESEPVVLQISEVAHEYSQTETPLQRRTRWFVLYGKGERGAVQRVYKQELLLNSKADRSFIGKQIKVAKTEHDNKTQAGMWNSQLVRDGKRKH
jgi:hypothetical protein